MGRLPTFSKTQQARRIVKRKNETDAALAAIEGADAQGSSAAAARPPVGVIPDLLAQGSSESMSLGSRRLCTDPASRPNRKRGEWKVIDAYDQPIVACIEWRRVTFYRDRSAAKAAKPEPRSTDGNLTRGIFNGYMSPATRRKVRKSISTWVRSILMYRAEIKRQYDPGRAYPVMVTVTLPSDQVHPDKEITRKCLHPFLAWLKRSHGIEHYFWRAESQQNGRIHYHILTDRYIRGEDLQVAWNRSINKLGYVDRYYDHTGEAEPPSTEVHAIRDRVKDKRTGEWRTVDPVDYLLDYLMDAPAPEAIDPNNEQQQQGPRKLIGKWRRKDGSFETYEARAIDGRCWGMSDGLRSIREPRALASVRLITALEEARSRDTLRRVDMDHATLYFGDVALTLGRAHPGMWQLIKTYYIQVFAFLYPDQLPPEYSRGRSFLHPSDLWIDLQEFALYHREPPVIDQDEAEQTNEELISWTWITMDGHKVHRNLHSILNRWPLLRKYGLDQWLPFEKYKQGRK